MNTKKIVSMSGTVLLTAVAVFVGRASSSRTAGTPATNLFVKNGTTCIATSLTGGTFSGSNFLTTGGTGGAVASIKTASGTYALYNTSACGATHRINFVLP